MRIGFKSKLTGLAVACALVATPAAHAESLSDAMASAYKNSGLLDQNQALLRAADEDVAIAQARLRPVLSYAIQHTWIDPTTLVPNDDYWRTSATLTASVLLFNFGRGKMAVEARKKPCLRRVTALSVSSRACFYARSTRS